MPPSILYPEMITRRVRPLARGGFDLAARGWEEQVRERLAGARWTGGRRWARRRRRARRPQWRPALMWMGLGALVGAGLMLLLDPQAGKRRRALIRDQAVHAGHVVTRDVPEQTSRWARYAGGRIQGAIYQARHAAGLAPEEAPPELDQYITDKVESEVLGDPKVPKGALNINAVDGVVYVRGRVEDKDTADYVLHRISRVEGVREVRNLLTTPAGGA
jgi:hypothetical protein